MPAASNDAETPIAATVEIVNRRGLHARASAKFCAIAASYDARVTVARDELTVGGRSIMGLLMLGAGIGSTIEISATGPQAREAVETLARLVADKFGERD